MVNKAALSDPYITISEIPDKLCPRRNDRTFNHAFYLKIIRGVHERLVTVHELDRPCVLGGCHSHEHEKNGEEDGAERGVGFHFFLVLKLMNLVVGFVPQLVMGYNIKDGKIAR